MFSAILQLQISLLHSGWVTIATGMSVKAVDVTQKVLYRKEFTNSLEQAKHTLFGFYDLSSSEFYFTKHFSSG